MFKSLLDTNFFNDELTIAKNTVISDDRKKYYPIFADVKSLLKNNDTVIFSNVSDLCNFYLGKKRKMKDSDAPYTETQLIIYSTHSRKITTLITNQIHKKYGKFVQMRANIPNQEYEVIYNLRPLIKIYHIHRYKKVEILKLFDTVTIDKLLYFPAEVELMDIYHKLYLPNFYEEWENLEKEKKILHDINIIKKKLKQSPSQSVKNNPCQKSRSIIMDQIKLIMLQYFNNENIVLLGEWAQYTLTNKNLTTHANFLSQTDPKTKKRNTFPLSQLQIISENSIEIDYKNIVMYLSKFIKYGIYFKKRKLYVPKNNRIYKHTLYVKFPTMKPSSVDKPFLDIYNCGLYEVIPCVKYTCKINEPINLKIGCRYLFIYILLVEMWIIKLLFRLETIDKNIYSDKISNIYNMIKWAEKNIPVYTKTYIGVNFNEKIYQNLVISANHIKKTSYYPEKNIKKYKNYKLIATSS